MKKSFILLVGLFWGLTSLHAQTLSRQVIASTGSANNQLSSTTGETIVSTAVSGSFILTQGFQQPDNVSVNIREPEEIQVSYSLYPNPAHDVLTLELSTPRPIEVQVHMIDMAGKQASPTLPIRVENSLKQELDVSGLASGVYALHIMTMDRKAVTTLTFEKLD